MVALVVGTCAVGGRPTRCWSCPCCAQRFKPRAPVEAPILKLWCGSLSCHLYATRPSVSSPESHEPSTPQPICCTTYQYVHPAQSQHSFWSALPPLIWLSRCQHSQPLRRHCTAAFVFASAKIQSDLDSDSRRIIVSGARSVSTTIPTPHEPPRPRSRISARPPSTLTQRLAVATLRQTRGRHTRLAHCLCDSLRLLRFQTRILSFKLRSPLPKTTLRTSWLGSIWSAPHTSASLGRPRKPSLSPWRSSSNQRKMPIATLRAVMAVLQAFRRSHGQHRLAA